MIPPIRSTPLILVMRVRVEGAVHHSRIHVSGGICLRSLILLAEESVYVA